MIDNSVSVNAEHKIKVSEETRKEIFKQVEINYMNDVQEMICGKKCWRRTGITFETMSKVTVAVGGVLSFSAGYFNSNILSFISGSVSVVSLALLQFGSFGFKQSNKRGNDLNILLKKLDLDTIPVIGDDPDALAIDNNKTMMFKGIKNNNEDVNEDENNTVKHVSEIPPEEKPDNKETIDTENIDMEIAELTFSKKLNKIKIIDGPIQKDALKLEDNKNIATT